MKMDELVKRFDELHNASMLEDEIKLLAKGYAISFGNGGPISDRDFIKKLYADSPKHLKSTLRYTKKVPDAEVWILDIDFTNSNGDGHTTAIVCIEDGEPKFFRDTITREGPK